MNKKQYIKSLLKPLVFIGEFENETGEQYVVSKIQLGKVRQLYFVGGDMTGWSTMQVTEDVNSLVTVVHLSDDEKRKLLEIIYGNQKMEENHA